jgi:hypothetical protein
VQPSDADRADVARTLSERLGTPAPGKLDVRAVGAFRFAGNDEILYIDRTDLHSLVFERASYGRSVRPLDDRVMGKETLVPRIEKLMHTVYPTKERPQFAEFDDEYAGAAPMKAGATPPDPRKLAVHVARIASFNRVIEGVPVFGSEMLVGLDGEGRIGRLRVHWPTIGAETVAAARRLQEMVKSKKWEVPKELRQPDTEILDVSAGVGHSGIADPEFRSDAVVRVLVRRTPKGTEHPISSTSYVYFAADGRQIEFSSFPPLQGSEAAGKAADRQAGVKAREIGSLRAMIDCAS